MGWSLSLSIDFLFRYSLSDSRFCLSPSLISLSSFCHLALLPSCSFGPLLRASSKLLHQSLPLPTPINLNFDYIPWKLV